MRFLELALKIGKTLGKNVLDESKESVINTFVKVISLKQNMFIFVKLFSLYLLFIFTNNFIEGYNFSYSFLTLRGKPYNN